MDITNNNATAPALFDPNELLFKAQTCRKGEKVKPDGTPVESNWVFGGVFPGKGDFSIIYSFDPIDKFPVYTDTICQYVRLLDKNGTKAFTGHITKDDWGRKWVIFATAGGFAICRSHEWVTRNDSPAFIFTSLSDAQNADWFRSTHEIIGNIFDDPELLDDQTVSGVGGYQIPADNIMAKFQVLEDADAEFVLLKDKKGKKVFTGDIVQDTTGLKGVVVVTGNNIAICSNGKWVETPSASRIEFVPRVDEKTARAFAEKYEVIGNSFIDAKLLKG